MSELKLCVYCEHCEYTEAEFVYGYSMGDWMNNPFYTCEKEKFNKEDSSELKGWSLKAMTCPDYELDHKVAEEINRKEED